MAFVAIEDIGKTYTAGRGGAPVRVLEGIYATIEEGEFVCLMGPSGSGKSTLLTVIGGMNRPTQGRLLIDGIDVYALSDEARADFRREYLGFVFQQHHLLAYLTAAENVMLPLTTCPLRSGQKRERAARALERVGLVGKADRLPGQLSGGEQGRVAIARALVNNAPLVLADEPTGALDSRTGHEVMGVLRGLHAQGQTFLMVTHNSDNAAAADRIIQICDGRLVATGTLPREGVPPESASNLASSVPAPR